MRRAAAQLEPSHFRARKLLGSAQYALADLAAARDALTSALALRPDYADAHCDLGAPFQISIRNSSSWGFVMIYAWSGFCPCTQLLAVVEAAPSCTPYCLSPSAENGYVARHDSK